MRCIHEETRAHKKEHVRASGSLPATMPYILVGRVRGVRKVRPPITNVLYHSQCDITSLLTSSMNQTSRIVVVVCFFFLHT